MVLANPTVCHCVVYFVRTVEHGEGVERSVDTLVARLQPAKVLGMFKAFRQVGTSGSTRWEPGMRTVRGRGAGTRPLWGFYGPVCGVVPIFYCIVMVCERVHAVSISYFGVAIYILVQQYIFQSSNTYFRVAIHISQQQYIFQSSI